MAWPYGVPRPWLAAPRARAIVVAVAGCLSAPRIAAPAIEVALTPELEQRARGLHGLGFAPLDALYLACAEAAGATWFVTCDDRLARVASRHVGELRATVTSPLELPRRMP
jgi:predicted nucleic acid-binding protein